MYCSKCGKEIIDYKNFCPFCGTSVIEIPSSQDSTTKKENFSDDATVSSETELLLRPLYSYQANIGFNNGTLNIYEEYIHFVSKKNKDILLRYCDMSKAEEFWGTLNIYPRNGKMISIALPKDAVKELLSYVQGKISAIQKIEQERPESHFEKSFGLHDKILINDEYKSFCIKYANGNQTPTYYLKDIVDYEIKEINKDGDTLSGALMGQYIAGRSGAVLGAQLASGSSNITEVQCRIMLQTESDTSVLLVKLALPLFSVSQTSNKYSAIKAEEMKLDSYLKTAIKNNTNDKQASTTNNTGNSTNEIRKFKELMDEGIITEEEFIAKKRQLLGI